MLKKIEKKHHTGRLKEIEQMIKKIEMQMEPAESPDPRFDINKLPGDRIGGETTAYWEIIHKALSVAFSDIFENAREIERTNRVIADFHEEKNGGNETNRILANIEDKRRKEVISRREKEILNTLPWEKTNKEISRELGISEKTVKNHLWKIYRKLGVKNRTELFRHLSSL